ncbi:hypothetical protein G3578_14105 [Brevibacillus sp. SYP-B805]|uniref:papain-like cysteine protease family protein n=1 Tax=Brevibacillus sp. SYP-B805 TaxID=1578199 RepID=UPI0013EE1896|nr:papain-like cysteine protease family protein [Brevibacillus sp. SYP-B805]NGQ96295.1 hypothetical protein [Brevibacillus sp. SYP-B805]
MKKLNLLSVLSVLASLSFASHAFASPAVYSIGVSEELQQEDEWCWAAASVSILDYFGESVDQDEVVEYVKGDVINEGATDSEVQDGLEHWGVDSTRTTSYLSFSTIKSEIYNYERPIYAGWTWDTGGGHAVVLDGYDDDTTDYVEYMDPWDGDHKSSTYNWFKSSSDHVWDGTLYKMR